MRVLRTLILGIFYSWSWNRKRTCYAVLDKRRVYRLRIELPYLGINNRQWNLTCQLGMLAVAFCSQLASAVCKHRNLMCWRIPRTSEFFVPMTKVCQYSSHRHPEEMFKNLKNHQVGGNVTWELQRRRHFPARIDKSVVAWVGFTLTSSSISWNPMRK